MRQGREPSAIGMHGMGSEWLLVGIASSEMEYCSGSVSDERKEMKREQEGENGSHDAF